MIKHKFFELNFNEHPQLNYLFFDDIVKSAHHPFPKITKYLRRMVFRDAYISWRGFSSTPRTIFKMMGYYQNDLGIEKSIEWEFLRYYD